MGERLLMQLILVLLDAFYAFDAAGLGAVQLGRWVRGSLRASGRQTRASKEPQLTGAEHSIFVRFFTQFLIFLGFFDTILNISRIFLNCN